MRNKRAYAVVSALTVFALLVHGYHPYGEDGGVYLAGIKKLLHPGLYPYWTAFVTEHLRFSLFAPAVAALVRGTHLGLEPTLFLLYVLSVWSTLAAGWALLARATDRFHARCGGTALLACWLTIPIAGTSLMLADPYLTARSFTTPLTLLALAWAWDWQRGARTALPCLLALALAACLHPLMAGYALAAVVLFVCAGSSSQNLRRWGPLALLAAGLSLAAILQLHAPAESANYTWIAMTRYYWFPFRWEWYEQLGLVAPLALLWWLSRGSRGEGCSVLARTAIALSLISLAVAIGFSRAHLATHLVARMQPLRCYGTVYQIMILVLGAWAGERILRGRPWRWALLLAVFGALMGFVQRSTYPASAHLELPGRKSRNSYVQAFLWTRGNTPTDALFALDARYITQDGEDAQSFRPIAERSALADYSKDGGEAAITPALTSAWVESQAAETGLNQASDQQRLRRLQPFGVTWVVLATASPTAWACPYRNAAVKVCRLP